MSEDETSAGISAQIEQARNTGSVSERVRRRVEDVYLDETGQLADLESSPPHHVHRSLFFTFALTLYVHVVEAIALFLYRLVGADDSGVTGMVRRLTPRTN